MSWTWDGETCGRDYCGGELEQQDALNVMCLACETVWTHYQDDDKHKLIRQETVVDKELSRVDA